MRLWRFVGEDGEIRWAIQREKGGEFEVVRRRSSGNFAQFAKALTKGKKRIDERLALKRPVKKLPGRLLVPTQASKIVCVGLNYRQHAEEMGKAIPEVPLLFMKPTTSLVPHGGRVELPEASEEVHFEGELAIVVGRLLREASVEEARAGILGYTCADDVTARDIQRRESRYTRAKGYDTFCPLGPCVRLGWSWGPGDHKVTTRVNGTQRQRSGFGDMIHGVGEVASFVSYIMTLLPGDVILTGTPSGVGPIVSGDEVSVEIQGIGKLEHTVS